MVKLHRLAGVEVRFAVLVGGRVGQRVHLPDRRHLAVISRLVVTAGLVAVEGRRFAREGDHLADGESHSLG